jgi:xanthine dehydrogenase YagT iron-sulfur-binding subunit
MEGASTTMPISHDLELNRRDLMVGGSTLAALTAVSAVVQAQPASAGEPALMKISLAVNGQTHDLEIDTRTTLLDALREHLHLTGSKKGCDHGQCGACTVLINGRRVNSCLTLAIMNEGMEITTIEGLGAPGNLHPMQEAFIKHDRLPVRLLHAGSDLFRRRRVG